VPRWLLLLLLGVAAGAAGVLLVQERYLPPRLTVQASAELRASLERAEAERARLQAELAGTAQRLAAASADKQRLGEELAASRAAQAPLREDLAMVLAALPPDPRGGSVQVRAGRFAASTGSLAYELVLTRESSTGKPLAGVLQLVLAGDNARGSESNVTTKPLAVSLAGHQVLRGSLPLPEGFRPRQATVQVLDRIGGKSLGMRVLLVRG